MDKIEKYFKYTNKKVFQRIIDEDYNDLELESVFHFLNHALSPIGEQYLYSRLRNIPLKNEVKENEDWLLQYSQDSNLRAVFEKILRKLEHRDMYNICSLFQQEHPKVDKRKMVFFRIMQFIPFIALLIYIIFSFKLAVILCFLFLVLNFLLHYRNKLLLVLYSDSLPQLLKVIYSIEKLSKTVNIKADIQMDLLLKDIVPLKRRLSFFQFDIKLENDLMIFAWLVSELIRIFFLTDPISLYQTFSVLNEKRDRIEEMFNYIGLVDTLQSINTVRNKLSYYCTPQYSEEYSKPSAEKMFHPLIEHCVENSFQMNQKSYLIMGSNMSGKTTFIRTVALNVLMAQTLNTCFAKSFCLNYQKIWTDISLVDSLSEGRSYYLTEVLRMKNIIDETISGNNLIIIDELFKGTNTEERITATKAVLNFLSKNRGNTLFVASHDTELCKLLDGDQFSIIHFSEKIENDTLSFTYTIQQGEPTQKNAIKILKIYGYPSEIIDNANYKTDAIQNYNC